MTFQERLGSLRKQRGLSQEELAGEVGVTRQAVQKWESGASRPDMDNLVILSRYFGVTLDYLITGAEGAPAPPSPAPTVINNYYHTGSREYEYKSRRTLWGLPLVHIHLKDNSLVCARGVIAIGNVALGVVSVGCLSAGVVSLGVCSAGLLLAVGCLSLGVLSLGCVAAGIIAAGLISWGWLSLGGVVCGVYGIGGVVEASEIAIGGVAEGPLAIGRVVKGAATVQLPEGELTPEARAAIREAVSEALSGRHPWLQALLERLT